MQPDRPATLRIPADPWLRAVGLSNLLLLVLFPLSWTAPILRAGLLPWLGLSEVSILSGLAALWDDAPMLAALVALFALVAPVTKTLALAAIHAGWVGPRALPALAVLGKLAMADVFLIALYVVVARGVGVGRVEIAWGLWLFTACVLLSLACALVTDWRLDRARQGQALPRTQR
ncbi:MAG: paraquat-inducible protein A [Rhodobacteraceae bacterium]|jgi:uncharacterized paraquat-inducible protein A|nr:paraquat-inducible protein A [Paracoccaceae bacterium]